MYVKKKKTTKEKNETNTHTLTTENLSHGILWENTHDFLIFEDNIVFLDSFDFTTMTFVLEQWFASNFDLYS